MPKQKPSFLQRLTGATEEEAQAENTPKKTMAKKPEIKKDYGEQPTEPKTERKLSTAEESPEPSTTTEKEENWPSEAEGQLTIDVYQNPSEIIIKSTIAGIKPEDLDITITNDMVTIKGERKQDEVVQDENYYYQECYWGKFSRSVILPVDVVSEEADASMKNGILTIKLPKAEQLKTKKIQVKSISEN